MFFLKSNYKVLNYKVVNVELFEFEIEMLFILECVGIYGWYIELVDIFG